MATAALYRERVQSLHAAAHGEHAAVLELLLLRDGEQLGSHDFHHAVIDEARNILKHQYEHISRTYQTMVYNLREHGSFKPGGGCFSGICEALRNLAQGYPAVCPLDGSTVRPPQRSIPTITALLLLALGGRIRAAEGALAGIKAEDKALVWLIDKAIALTNRPSGTADEEGEAQNALSAAMHLQKNADQLPGGCQIKLHGRTKGRAAWLARCTAAPCPPSLHVPSHSYLSPVMIVSSDPPWCHASRGRYTDVEARCGCRRGNRSFLAGCHRCTG